VETLIRKHMSKTTCGLHFEVGDQLSTAFDLIYFAGIQLWLPGVELGKVWHMLHVQTRPIRYIKKPLRSLRQGARNKF